MQIFGLGRQTNLKEIAELVEREYANIHGRPWKLTLRSDEHEIECERGQADAPFHSWTLRLKTDGELLETLRDLASEFSEDVSLQEVDGRWEFRCRSVEAIEKLAEVLTLPEVWQVEGEDPPADLLSPARMFEAMKEKKASDVHLYPGAVPVFRINNITQPSTDFAPVSQRQIESLIREMAPEADWQAFVAEKQCSFNYRQVGVAYSRVSAFIKAGVPHCTIRYLPEVVPSFEELHIPRSTMEHLAGLHEGLILVSGMTGSGKSTTVASLVDWINANKSLHILTIESPVEFVHVNKKSIVSQRNVGTDTPTAIDAVYGALRHDPDVIYIGEMRTSDTIRAAIDAASTGHLVISTFHANNAAEVVNRIVSFFDPVERDLVRLQLRDCIRCVMCQRLVPRKEGGRVPALEFLMNDTKQIGDCIITGNTAALRVAMQQTSSESTILEKSLLSLIKEGLIAEETAAEYASNVAVLEQMRLGTYAIPSLDSMVSKNRGF